MLTFAPALLRQHLIPEPLFRIQIGPYLTVASGQINGQRVLIPGIRFQDVMAAAAAYLVSRRSA